MTLRTAPETDTATDRYAESRDAFSRALALMPGGVNSPVRAYKAVARSPIFVREGHGAVVTDLDGNTYVDYVCSYGPLILGHSPIDVVAAVTAAAKQGTSFGMPTEAETTLARMVVDAVPSIEIVRFVNSGTEAVMSAIRLARAATGRPKVIKCTGCYHGHSDSLLVQAGSGATTLGVPSSPGVPESVTAHTVLVPFNDSHAVESALAKHAQQVACVAVEPVAGNMGCIQPKEGYLQELRALCDRHGTLLLFDEVMTGFRVAYGGAQQLYGVMPDLTCLGKVVGGGLPCAAYGGNEDLMRQVAPDGPMYQAGTLSGNPLAIAAGIATLKRLANGEAYDVLDWQSAKLVAGLEDAAASAGVPVSCTHVGSMVGCFFCPDPVETYEQATAQDTEAFTAFFGQMLDRGVVLPPSAFETWFVSTAHDDTSIGRTIDAAEAAFATVASRSS